MKRGLDVLDKALIGTLSDNGRWPPPRSPRAWASRSHRTGPLRQLVEARVVRIAALVNASETPELTIAIVGLSLERYNLDEMVERMAALDEVSWAAVVTGRYDIIAEVVTTAGMNGLYDFLNASLQELGAFSRVRCSSS